MSQYVGIVPEEDIGIIKEIVEVHGTGRKETVAIVAVDSVDHRTPCVAVGFHHILQCRVFLGRYKCVFGRGYRVGHDRRLVNLVVEIHILDNRLDEILAVGSVIDRKIALVAEPVGRSAGSGSCDAPGSDLCGISL